LAFLALLIARLAFDVTTSIKIGSRRKIPADPAAAELGGYLWAICLET
jgi:hypothetical protein